MLPSENPYAASAPPPELKDADEQGRGFDPLLLVPSLSFLSIVVVIKSLFSVCYGLWCVYALQWVFTQTKTPSHFVVSELAPAVIVTLAYVYVVLTAVRYRRSINQLAEGMISWQQFALSHNRLWRVAAIVDVVLLAVIVAMWTMKPGR